MLIDTNTDFGRRVHRRLQEERIAWLTTVDSRGGPQPRPVWFLWQEGHFLIYSRPGTAKLRHIAQNARASLNLDSDGRGGDIVVFTGSATIAADAPPADQVPAYVEKYHSGFERLGSTPARFASTYSVALRLTPDNLRGH